MTDIGEKAFGNMEHLSRIVCYADPNNLNWDNIVDAKDPKTEVHVLTGYEGNLPTASNVDFVADLTDPYASADTKERNITAFYGSVNSHIFGGSAPYHRRQVRQRQKIRHLRQRGLCHLRVL